MSLRISSPSLTTTGERREFAAEVAGDRLWFRVPREREVAIRGEPFVSAAIVPAMARGEPLVVDPALPICPVFLDGVHQFMDVFRFWGRDLGLPLRPVEIHATLEPPTPAAPGVNVLFSGGVDGIWSLCEHHPPASEATFVHGIDFQLDNPMAAEAVRRNRAWLDRRGVPLLEVETNVRFVGTRLGVRWNKHNGACLAGIGHLVGAATTIIASGFSWHFTGANGTHLATDPLLSSATRRIVHHGFGHPRWQKLHRIAREPGVLEMLRVCWQDRGYNCGRCEKCHRTMLLLALLELESPAFPQVPVGNLVPTRIDDAEGLHYLRQALDLARHRGRGDVTRLLERTLRRRQWLQAIRRLDDAFLGGTLQRVRSILRRNR